jgi:hypothetical protein
LPGEMPPHLRETEQIEVIDAAETESDCTHAHSLSHAHRAQRTFGGFMQHLQMLGGIGDGEGGRLDSASTGRVCSSGGS